MGKNAFETPLPTGSAKVSVSLSFGHLGTSLHISLFDTIVGFVVFYHIDLRPLHLGSHLYTPWLLIVYPYRSLWYYSISSPPPSLLI